MKKIDTKIDTIHDQEMAMNNAPTVTNGMIIDEEHHQMNEGTQAIDLVQAIEEVCLDNDTTITIGTPSTREIEDHHEIIDPLEIDPETAIAATPAITARELEVNHPIVHRQITDDRLLILCNSRQNITPVLFQNFEKNGQLHHHHLLTQVNTN